MGTAWGLLLPLRWPGMLMPPRWHCLGCDTLAPRSWGHQRVSGVCHTVSVALQAGTGLGSPRLSREWGVEGALPVPSSPPPSSVPAPAFGGCLVPIPVLAGGEQHVGGGVLVYSQSWNWWGSAPRTRQALGELWVGPEGSVGGSWALS